MATEPSVLAAWQVLPLAAIVFVNGTEVVVVVALLL
jgi:hypothetical protein